jgi:hypothetical protein
MPVRRVWAALLAIVTASGCRALSNERLAGRDPLTATPSSIDVAAVVAQHNRNAQPVVALQAKPTVAISYGARNKGGGGAHGRMALERPRNFRLTLEAGMTTHVADVGSNPDEFWVWTGQSKEKAIYVCQYDENGDAPAELSFQPDWIIEGLGLRVISDDEASEIRVEKATDPRYVILAQRRGSASGASVLKKTAIVRATGQIQEHVFYAGDGRTVLARVFPVDYRSVPITSADGSTTTIALPRRIKIESTPPGQEPVKMDIVLDDLKLNPAFDEEQRQVLFTVPHIPNTTVVNVNEQLGPRQGRATVRETRPAPEPGARVRLGDPVPLGPEGRGNPGEPAPVGAAAGGSAGGLGTLVGPRYPTPAGDDAVLAAEARRATTPVWIER